jgi:hypothetical protein
LKVVLFALAWLQTPSSKVGVPALAAALTAAMTGHMDAAIPLFASAATALLVPDSSVFKKGS